ncbi:SGNH/GDSL hydrolase family protein [Amycolatopsis suaedae]|uniref:SGNH/GDSL hydrolase family protein n=1 Tax=Amycolatopsis suaedae TaxID=2510978 RepID=A0A4V2ELE8_9PSEU|nr:SGNH/GDSL hydrolase family protein [Amycolatopsis suaedae]
MGLAAVTVATALIGVPAPPAAAAQATYVALGSSFAAGPGIPPPKPGGPAACGRSANNYATLVAARFGLRLVDATCSGATTADILTRSQHGQGPQIDAVTASTDLVTVTIGGNDVNYVGSLFAYACQNTGAPNCPDVDQDAMNTALAGVAGKIGDVIAAVHRKAPRARVLVVNYQTILPRTGPACEGVPLTPAQLRFERTVALRLAAATRLAAVSGRATLVDAAAASAAHDACAAQPWMERFTTSPGRVPYHPNAAGMAAVADLVGRALS